MIIYSLNIDKVLLNIKFLNFVLNNFLKIFLLAIILNLQKLLKRFD